VLDYPANYTIESHPNQRILHRARTSLSPGALRGPQCAKDHDADAVKFLRRFVQHVLPPRFTRVRYYGFLANRDRAANIAAARLLIASRRPLRPPAPIPDPRLCPQCRKGTMRRIAPVDPQCHRIWFDTS
jgi:hypothetical protein